MPWEPDDECMIDLEYAHAAPGAACAASAPPK
jgi:hypothetical protein